MTTLLYKPFSMLISVLAATHRLTGTWPGDGEPEPAGKG
jgi:hypothetical protein